MEKLVTKKISAYTIAVVAVMTATLSLGKFIFSFIAGFEIVTLMIFVYAKVFGLESTLFSVLAFIGIDAGLYGIQPWLLMYLLHFPTVAIVGFFVGKLKINPKPIT